MSMYFVQIEWNSKGRRLQGLVFFEADSLEKAKVEAPEAVAHSLIGEHSELVIHEPLLCQPTYLVMWDRAQITAMITPGLTRLDAAVKVN